MFDPLQTIPSFPVNSPHTWGALQTFNAGLQLAAGQAIRDSGGADRIRLNTTTPQTELLNDVRIGAAEKVLIGVLPGGHAQADDGVRFNATGSIPSGVFSQTPSATAGENVGIAINTNLVGTYQTGRVGGYLRIDTGGRRMVLQGYNGSTFIDMFSVPLHTGFLPSGANADAWIRTDDGEVRVRGKQGGNACIVDIQGFATNSLSAFRLIPKGSPSPDRALCQFFGTDFKADGVNYTALAHIATASKMIVRSQGEGTESAVPLAFEIRDGGVNYEGLRVDFSGGVIRLGFYATTPATKQTVTGSRGGNAALASLLTALATVGLLTDSSTA